MTKFVCKFCKVEVTPDGKAILGREHKKSCPRKNKG